MRSCTLAIALATALCACGDDGATRRLPPESVIDDKPAALSNQGHVVITFHAAGIADSYTCSLDGAAEAECSSPFTADLADGDHTFVVRAAIGDVVDESPADYAWKIDTVAPETEITSAPPVLDNAAAPELVFAGSDNNGAVTLECALDGAAFAACTSPTTLTALADGSHTFAARAVDAAGNVDPTPATATWTLDSSAPDTMIASGPAAGSSTKAAVSFAFTSPDSPVTFECAIDGAAFAACTTPKAYTLAEGAHTFAVRALDDTGLADPSPAMRSWTVDLTAPAVAITAGPATVSNDSTPAFSFTVTDATTIECKVDGGAFAACTSPFTAAALVDGAHTFTVRGTDAAGNAASQSRAFTIDTVPPTVNVADVASPNRDTTPSVSFTTAGGATSTQCQVDATSAVTCSSPFTTPALLDGSHTVTVRAFDAAGNAGSDATTFTIDATPPAVTIDDAPPALWPVNYFDMRFHTTDATATLTCSLNGAAFTACASPLATITAYNTSSTFAVRATDPAGNVTTTPPRTWTAQNGLVLHYPWEQGQTHNTSLLAQNAPYSPDGNANVTPIGGWAGTAANSPSAHIYKTTIRPLSSSANNTYTASVWIRVASGSDGGVIFSNLTASNGVELRFAGRQVILTVNDAGKTFTASAVISSNQWVQVGVLATGPAKGVQLLVNGNVVGNAAAPSVTGFGPGQATDLTVGTIFGADLDDLRFYNRALSTAERCTILVRGEVGATGACVPLSPGMEIDFERGQIIDTGVWNLPISTPTVVSFLPGSLGDRLRLDRGDQSFAYLQSFGANANASPGRSLSLWFFAGGATDTLVDFLQQCAAGASFTCGIRVLYDAGGKQLLVAANSGTPNGFGVAISVDTGRMHSLVITEQKANPNGTTAKLSIYVDGVLTTLPIGTGNVYGGSPDQLTLPHNVNGTQLDELEFWPRDLSLDPEMLCENGWDGEWNPATATCLLTSN